MIHSDDHNTTNENTNKTRIIVLLDPFIGIVLNSMYIFYKLNHTHYIQYNILYIFYQIHFLYTLKSRI